MLGRNLHQMLGLLLTPSDFHCNPTINCLNNLGPYSPFVSVDGILFRW